MPNETKLSDPFGGVVSENADKKEVIVDPFGDPVGEVTASPEHEDNIFTRDVESLTYLIPTPAVTPVAVKIKDNMLTENLDPYQQELLRTAQSSFDSETYNDTSNTHGPSTNTLPFATTGYVQVVGGSLPIGNSGYMLVNCLPYDSNNLFYSVNWPPVTPTIQYKYTEDTLLKEIKEYIDSTYTQHYSGKYQATDMIIDAGHGVGFCIGNILKYGKRYGKKDGYNRKDLMKIIHYAIIALYVHDEEQLSE